MRIHTGMVTLWYSTAMVVYSYGQVRITTVFSQELLAVTVKLATREREKGRREGGEGEKRGREATICDASTL